MCDRRRTSRRDSGRCRFCGQQATLCYSHIIPEFLYKPLYDEKHRFLRVSAVREESTFHLQKGLREYLLCQDCETHFSKLERYAHSVFCGDTKLVSPAKFTLKGIDYKKFKLFGLSLLWRMGVSGLVEFSEVELGPHETRILRMLKDEDPGEPHEYGFVLVSLHMPDGELLDLIAKPEPLLFFSHRVYRADLAGFRWLFLVCKHSVTFPRKDLLLQRDGQLIVLPLRVQDDPLLLDEIRQMKSRRKLTSFRKQKS